ncbi:YbeD family protein [Planctomicrobium sp. SH527]|uniref:YbeD family protein n=1 Tax=Planctomicrobium sp. SH527 TaxID=3448123 RepID=UPI003F5C7E66
MQNGLPTLEILEANHSFPCSFTFKVIGVATEQFADSVLVAVKKQLEGDFEPAISSKATPSGRHISVTVEPQVASAAHIHEIYRELQSLEGLVMLF